MVSNFIYLHQSSSEPKLKCTHCYREGRTANQCQSKNQPEATSESEDFTGTNNGKSLKEQRQQQFATLKCISDNYTHDSY